MSYHTWVSPILHHLPNGLPQISSNSKPPPFRPFSHFPPFSPIPPPPLCSPHFTGTLPGAFTPDLGGRVRGLIEPTVITHRRRAGSCSHCQQ